jgi:23S rRNA (pseudouridine1915-N3)-methyltransferase
MTTVLLVVGKTEQGFVEQGINLYLERLRHYGHCVVEVVADIKLGHTLPRDILKEKEGVALLKKILPGDIVILLDERGQSYTSRQFAGYIEKHRLRGAKRLVFVIGGAFGFSDAVYSRAGGSVALSMMTMSHQLVRVVFMEQLYRANTILRNEQYHHD